MKMRDDKVKLLLYCTKAKPYLEYKQIPRTLMEIDNSFEGYRCSYKRTEDDENFQLNGKIVAECDFEVENIEFEYTFHKGYSDVSFRTKQLQENELFNKSCLRYFEMTNYFNRRWVMEEKGKCGYAIHIKNLHIFDIPRELSNYGTWVQPLFLNKGELVLKRLVKAPQNMMYAELDDIKYVLISIRPEWLCKILNGEKTIEVRKKVLKEML